MPQGARGCHRFYAAFSQSVAALEPTRRDATRGAFPELLPESPQPGTYSAGLIPLWERDNSTSDHVMLVGDAAWQVKPSTGGGIHSGLVGAKYCAAQAVSAVRDGAFSRAALAP